MDRVHIKKIEGFLDKDICIKGWVYNIREHGKVAFLDIKDISGIVQCVITQKIEDFSKMNELSKGACVEIYGKVNKDHKELKMKKVMLVILKFQLINLIY